jgi:hypothetical protein
MGNIRFCVGEPSAGSELMLCSEDEGATPPALQRVFRMLAGLVQRACLVLLADERLG